MWIRETDRKYLFIFFLFLRFLRRYSNGVQRGRVDGILKDFWNLSTTSGTITIKYASDADGSDSPGNAGGPRILWVSVFPSSYELCQELKCQILALCAVYTITCSDAASGRAAWYARFNTGVLT